MAAADAFIAVFDAKYHYNFWRPVTAIRNADLSGNPATPAMPPGSRSAKHPCIRNIRARIASPRRRSPRCCAASSARHRGDHADQSTAPGVERRWTRLDDYRDEVSNARIWAGFHYRFSRNRQGHGHGRSASSLSRRSCLMKRLNRSRSSGALNLVSRVSSRDDRHSPSSRCLQGFSSDSWCGRACAARLRPRRRRVAGVAGRRHRPRLCRSPHHPRATDLGFAGFIHCDRRSKDSASRAPIRASSKTAMSSGRRWRCLPMPAVPLEVVVRDGAGSNWALSCAGFAAFRQRSDQDPPRSRRRCRACRMSAPGHCILRCCSSTGWQPPARRSSW